MFAPLETGMNTLQSCYKLRYFNYVFTLPGKTEHNTKSADRLLQYIFSNRSFQAFTESCSMFLYFAVC